MIPPDMQGYALKRGEGRSIDFRGTKMTVKVPGVLVGESYSLIEMVHPPTVGPALHIHPTGAEAFYVLEGAYTIHCGEVIYQAAPGLCLYSKRRPASVSIGCERRDAVGAVACGS